MKRLFVALGVLAILAFVPAVASAQADHPVTTAKIQFSQPTLIGTQLVQPGEYRFECRVIDGQHTMIVTSSNGKEVARLRCTPVALDSTVKLTEYRSATRADGTLLLTEIRVKGENVGHRIVAMS